MRLEFLKAFESLNGPEDFAGINKYKTDRLTFIREK